MVVPELCQVGNQVDREREPLRVAREQDDLATVERLARHLCSDELDEAPCRALLVGQRGRGAVGGGSCAQILELA